MGGEEWVERRGGYAGGRKVMKRRVSRKRLMRREEEREASVIERTGRGGSQSWCWELVGWDGEEGQ